LLDSLLQETRLMSDTPEDLQEGLRVRAGRGAGEIPRLDSLDEDNIEGDDVEDLTEICGKLCDMLLTDQLACDVQLSLFVAACSSYRQDSTLRPFPPMYIEEGERDVESLLAAMRDLPRLATVLTMLEEGKMLDVKVLKLLLWVLSGGSAHLNLRTLNKVEAAEVLSLADTINHPPPSYVLAVTTSSSSRWLMDTREKKTFWAFHGSRLDNFHSILHYGLQQHRTKVSLFGEGIYLSEDLGVCLAYSSRGVGWSRSMLGNSVSCLALAQVVDHPSVKLHTEDAERGAVEGSEGGRVPDKYIVVRNNELLHIRYLLVYKHSSATPSLASNKLVMFINRNRMILLLLAYIFMLALIGLSKSTTVQRWLRRLGWVD